MWDGANTVSGVLRDGAIKQARSNVTGAQQGAPASDAVIFDIVDYELGMSHAQLIGNGVGRLDSDGAHGGPAAASAQLRFNAVSAASTTLAQHAKAACDAERRWGSRPRRRFGRSSREAAVPQRQDRC